MAQIGQHADTTVVFDFMKRPRDDQRHCNMCRITEQELEANTGAKLVEKWWCMKCFGPTRRVAEHHCGVCDSNNWTVYMLWCPACWEKWNNATNSNMCMGCGKQATSPGSVVDRIYWCNNCHRVPKRNFHHCDDCGTNRHTQALHLCDSCTAAVVRLQMSGFPGLFCHRREQ